MKKLLSVLLLCIMVVGTAACSPAAKEDEKVLKVASAGDYLGFTVYDETTKTWSGFEIDMWNEIAKRMGYQLQLVQEDVATGFGDLDNNRVDTVAKQISITPARKEKYDFTTPYFFSPYSLLVQGTSSIKSWADMNGKTIGLADGSAMNEFVEKLDPENKVNKKTYESFSTIPAEVVLGRVDAMPYATLLLPFLLQKNPTWDLKCVDTEHPIYTEINAYPFARTERGKKLREAVDATIKAMIQDGTHKAFCLKWFKSDVMETEAAKQYYNK